MSVFVRRVRLRNYKSIGACNVSLGPLTFLVGANGAGKSNFVDALRFVTESLEKTLEQAIRERSGIDRVRRISTGHPRDFGISLDLRLPDGRAASYAFEIGAQPHGGFAVKREMCFVAADAALGADAMFEVESGQVRAATPPIQSVIEPDRLTLGAASAIPAFRPLYEGLVGMGFYNFVPDRIRDLQDVDPGQKLAKDGRNIASVLRELRRSAGAGVSDRLGEQLRAVVPDLLGVEPKTLGPKETLEFLQRVKGAKHPFRFYASSMSDGTLRVLAVLVAVHQATANGGRRVTLVGIEEPEAALHPGAAEVLAEALVSASEHVQILVTTHSPDLLELESVNDERLLAVRMDEGTTFIGAVDPATRSALRDHLYTAGELLRQGQIEPEESARVDPDQLDLFAQSPHD